MTTQVEQQPLMDAVHKIVEAVHPKRIILFGSSARQERHQHSDYDLLVVMPDGADCSKLMGELYVYTMYSGIPLEFVVTTESSLKEHENNPGLIYKNALKEGIELYAA